MNLSKTSEVKLLPVYRLIASCNQYTDYLLQCVCSSHHIRNFQFVEEIQQGVATTVAKITSIHNEIKINKNGIEMLLNSNRKTGKSLYLLYHATTLNC